MTLWYSAQDEKENNREKCIPLLVETKTFKSKTSCPFHPLDI